jgi:hypothetical protein
MSPFHDVDKIWAIEKKEKKKEKKVSVDPII